MSETNSNAADESWNVYIIRSSDQRLYTGITNDVAKRWHNHCHSKTGAKFFRGRSPEKLVYVESGHDRSSASRREAQIKKLPRGSKLELIEDQAQTDWHSQFSLSQS